MAEHNMAWEFVDRDRRHLVQWALEIINGAISGAYRLSVIHTVSHIQ